MYKTQHSHIFDIKKSRHKGNYPDDSDCVEYLDLFNDYIDEYDLFIG